MGEIEFCNSENTKQAENRSEPGAPIHFSENVPNPWLPWGHLPKEVQF